MPPILGFYFLYETGTQVLMLTEAILLGNSILYPLSHGGQSFMWSVFLMTECMSLFLEKQEKTKTEI